MLLKEVICIVKPLYVIENHRVGKSLDWTILGLFNPRIIQSHIMSLLCPSDQELFIQKSSWSEGHNKADSWQWTASACKGSLALDVMYEPQINGRAIMPNLDNMKGQKGNRCVQHRLNIEEIPLISFAQDFPGGIRIRSYESIVFFQAIWTRISFHHSNIYCWLWFLGFHSSLWNSR